MESITVCGVEYKLLKARDFEVIVRSDNGFINYTKLCQQINGGRVPFRNIKINKEFKRLCIQMEISDAGFPAAASEVEIYEQIKDRIEIIEGGDNNNLEIARVTGTYMPRYLLDYVIMTCDISYYKLIHELMNVIDQVAQERQVKFVEELQSNINLQKAKLDKRKIKINDLKSTVERIERQNIQLKQDIEELLNLNVDSNQQITVMRKEIRNLNQDVNVMSTAITRVNENVGVLAINNQKLNMVHDVFIIYFSEYKPVDEDKRNDCADEEIWLGTYNGQLSNYRRSVPTDAYNLYQINSNRLDSYKFMTESQQLAEFILDTYQRSIKIRITDFHRFIDAVDNLMNSDGKYEAIRNVQVINEAIRRQERQHREANAIINRKKQLLQQYNDMHINILRYKRAVYAKINEELVKVNMVNNAYNYDWFYKYGSNGCNTCNILEPLLNKDIFTNDYDRRINYE